MLTEEILPQKTHVDLFSGVGQQSITQTFCMTLEHGLGHSTAWDDSENELVYESKVFIKTSLSKSWELFSC